MPGDIVLLEAGDIVPADLRVIKTHNFLADESVLTEEEDIFKAKNILFAGTSVISSKATAVVVATGKNTFLGDIVKLIYFHYWRPRDSVIS